MSKSACNTNSRALSAGQAVGSAPGARACRLLCACISAAAILLLCLVGCKARVTQTEKGDRNQELYIGNGSEPATLDPHRARSTAESYILLALFEGLVAEHPETLEPVPGVAESWEVSADGLCYIFHLRPDAKWSDGEPLTAQDFVYTAKRNLTRATAAANAAMYYPVRKARAFHTGEISDFSKVGIKAVSSHLLEITLDSPTPYFLPLLSHFAWYPVRQSIIESTEQQPTPHGSIPGAWARPGTLVGNGPFILADWKPNQSIKVARNPHYWDSDTVKLNAIHFLPIDSVETEERAFQAGYIHLTHSIPPHRIAYYRQRHPEVIRFDPYLGTYIYRFNCTRPPLDNPQVRRALALSIDREAIVARLLGGGQRPAYQLVPPGTGSITLPPQFSFDPDKARAVLAQAGYVDGEGFPSLTLKFNTSESHKQIAEAIQQMWREHLGVQVTLANQEYKVFAANVRQLDYDIARGSWIGDYNDPSTFLDMWHSASPNNRTGWQNAAYDSLLQRIAAAPQGDARRALVEAAEKLLMEEMPATPVYFYVRSLLIKQSVRGWHPNLLDKHPYKHVYLAPGNNE